MVKTITKHICEKCGRDNFKNIGAAKVHERRKIIEGDYEGIVFKSEFTEEGFTRYRIYAFKTDKISKEHEREYGYYTIDVKGDFNEITFNSLDVQTFSGIIEEKDAEREGLGENELSKLAKILKNKFPERFKDIKEFKTL